MTFEGEYASYDILRTGERERARAPISPIFAGNVMTIRTADLGSDAAFHQMPRHLELCSRDSTGVGVARMGLARQRWRWRGRMSGKYRSWIL